MTWTEETVDTLTELWCVHMWSASKIAALFAKEGCTRNAVIGKVNRLGLCRTQKGHKPAPPLGTKPPALEILAPPGPRNNIDCAAAPAPPISIPAAPAPILSCERVTLLDRAEHQCAWPLNDPASTDFRYCGALRSLPSSYCAEHRALARGPGTVSERRALTIIKRPQLARTYT